MIRKRYNHGRKTEVYQIADVMCGHAQPRTRSLKKPAVPPLVDWHCYTRKLTYRRSHAAHPLSQAFPRLGFGIAAKFRVLRFAMAHQRASYWVWAAF
jgi:hypothetical protein